MNVVHHRYFYWSTSSNLFRVPLSAMRTSSEECPQVPVLPATVVTTSNLNAFTIEQDEAIYLFGEFYCSNDDTNITAALSTSLSGLGDPFYNFAIMNSVNQVESFTKTFIVSSGSIVAYLSTDSATSCPNTASGSGLSIETFPAPVEVIRMYRDSQQPIPGTYVRCTHIRTYIRNVHSPFIHQFLQVLQRRLESPQLTRVPPSHGELQSLWLTSSVSPTNPAAKFHEALS